jgi:hypothetical protein
MPRYVIIKIIVGSKQILKGLFVRQAVLRIDVQESGGPKRRDYEIRKRFSYHSGDPLSVYPWGGWNFPGGLF